jgi:hypothetical protein
LEVPDGGQPEGPRKERPGGELSELHDIYARVDALTAGYGCETSGDCCRFGVTGREPYPTAIELFELERAVRARGGLSRRRALPLAPAVRDERRCPLLSNDGRCSVYASRPFGCRTFFCHRAHGPAGESPREISREAISELGRMVLDLSARFSPRDPGPRPLSRALSGWHKGDRR